MLCLNPKCHAVLTEYQWGEGYCSKLCMASRLDKGERISDCLHDRTGRLADVARTADEVDAFMEALELDPRLPRIIYLRRAGKTFRQIGPAMAPKIDAATCNRILASATPKLLRRCGL
jgi:hypothetical protein